MTSSSPAAAMYAARQAGRALARSEDARSPTLREAYRVGAAVAEGRARFLIAQERRRLAEDAAGLLGLVLFAFTAWSAAVVLA